MASTVKKAKKKPVTIEYMEWKGDNFKAIQAFMKGMCWEDNIGGLTIPTLEGNMSASKGDMIIKGVQGEFYPCKPSIFWETYDSV